MQPDLVVCSHSGQTRASRVVNNLHPLTHLEFLHSIGWGIVHLVLLKVGVVNFVGIDHLRRLPPPGISRFVDLDKCNGCSTGFTVCQSLGKTYLLHILPQDPDQQQSDKRSHPSILCGCLSDHWVWIRKPDSRASICDRRQTYEELFLPHSPQFDNLTE